MGEIELLPKLLFRHPPNQAGAEEKAEEFKNLWPEIEKLYKGKEKKLFQQFSALVYASYTENFLQNRNAQQHYQQLRYFFDFFIKKLDAMTAGGYKLPGLKVAVEQPPEETLPSDGHQIASSGIMLHVAESPFILENLGGYLNLSDHHIISGIHPVMTIKRKGGKITDILPSDADGEKEVFIYFSINKIVNPKSLEKLQKELNSTLKSLFLSVVDFGNMISEAEKVKDEMANHQYFPEEGKEIADFMKWLIPENFIFMGMTSYAVKDKKGQLTITEEEKRRFGVFHDPDLMEIVFPGLYKELEKKAMQSLDRYYMLVFDFLSTSPKIIYHRDAVEAVIIKHIGKNKKPNKVTILVGRFSRGALTSKSTDLPFLKQKLDRVLKAHKVRPRSHMERELVSAFNILPKKELFYIDRDTLDALLDISISLKSEEELHILIRQSPRFEYLTVILVFSERNLTRENLEKIAEYLEAKLGLKSVYVQTSRSPVAAQVFIYFPTNGKKTFEIDVERCSKEIKTLISNWDRLLMQKLVEKLNDQEGFSVYNRYIKRLSDLYKKAADPDEAVNDLLMLVEVESQGTIQLDISCESSTVATLRIYWDKELNLMKLIPTFANLGLNVKEELALPLKTNGGGPLYIQLLKIEDAPENIKRLESSKERLIEVIQLVIGGELEDGPLNNLVLSAGFNWKQVDLIRALQNYMLQVNPQVNPASVKAALNKYPEITTLGIELFEKKFNPENGKNKKLDGLREEFIKKLEDIADLTEDSILRLLLSVVDNTLRTNYFKKKENHFISFKIDCKGILNMPKPVPMAEIYVHSPFIEGIHLRGGKVARGGLRWSDRPDDFRTEVLGLMKTQMVKNAVIVPAGSKGGFVIKKFKLTEGQDRQTVFKYHYQTFIKGLLDLTDNLIGGEPVQPKDVVCYDEPDPYLVVAADKGTATMSDAANEISLKYDFWLKDAFASGGSIGYDHKKFGITARGAWECVKRHFRELGTDIQNDSITVIGVGGMAGDVFGNGMLLSRKLKLVAAFDHLNIFLDPDPKPEISYNERKRLFEKTSSTWADYNSELISKGGGVYSRASKSISLSKEVKNMLKTDKDAMSGLELIRTVLKMPADLLYLGGIGTYVRSSQESNADVGDKANDPVRVAANELRCKVIGEGANLGLTQKARLEFGENGGFNNTDSIDNSAGVDISDHEVNLKILLEIMLSKGELKSAEARNELFAKLGPEIADMVLEDNYLQSAGISLDKKRSERSLEDFCDYIDAMELNELFDRTNENIPSRDEILEYAEKPGYLVRPIFSVLFGYEKMRLNDAILNSNIVKTSFARKYFYAYFPSAIRHDHETSMSEHRLKKEIISTVLSNKIVNQAGISFVHGMESVTEAEPWEICRAYLIAENLLQADHYRKLVHALDNVADASIQIDLLIQMEKLIKKLVLWMLTHLSSDRISFDFVNQYQEVIANFQRELLLKLESLCDLREGCTQDKIDEYKKQNIPEELGKWLVVLPFMKDVMSILAIKEERHAEFQETGNLYILVTSSFEIDWIYNTLEKFACANDWEKKMVENLIRELESHQRKLVSNVLDFRRKGETMEVAFNNYVSEKDAQVAGYRETAERIKSEQGSDLVALSVLVSLLSEFA